MDDLAEVEAAIYDQSFRALDEQARVLDALRARAAALVAGASVATAVLGGLAGASASPARLDPASWVARSEYRRAIAFYNGRNFDANARQLRALDATFVVASVCLGCELVVWLWILAS